MTVAVCYQPHMLKAIATLSSVGFCWKIGSKIHFLLLEAGVKTTLFKEHLDKYPYQLTVKSIQTQKASSMENNNLSGKVNTTKKRILVVDDDVGILRVFKSILEKEGYYVETADTGKDALEKIQNETFDVCLVDVRLPDMDGTDLLLNLAGNPQTIKIIITGYSSEETGKKAADYGADDFLVKPVKAEELIATVKERLEISQQANPDVSG